VFLLQRMAERGSWVNRSECPKYLSERINAGREVSVTMLTDKRVERLQTIAAVADRMAEAKGQDRPIWRWIGAEAHAASEDLRELDRLHRAIANGDEGEQEVNA